MSREESKNERYVVDVESYRDTEMNGPLADALTRCGMAFEFRKPCAGSEFISPNAKIDLPDGGVELKHGDDTITTVELPDVEIAVNEAGVIMYLTISPEAYQKILDIIDEMESD